MTDIDDQYDDDVDQDDAPGTEPDGFGTFDDYRAARSQTRAAEAVTTVILGEEVELPPALPVGFEMRLHRLTSDRTTEAQAVTIMQELVAMLYGDDAFEAWQDDLDTEDLQILIIWGAANVREPYSMTFAEAAEAGRAEAGKARKVAGTRRPATRSRKPKRSGSSKR
ncbi:hypothetical protein [Nocardiopsis sp. HUAS JQ3]|uniref:hypothetical protein n=1 Tax=Nocardiopsis sp. HUAS JQ3 TaxID=3061629 RepID=UPI0023A9FEEC|nr:hypothetical protein [Nocardiopsis sp. HUAS JQ3]WDZ91142.1 hypothetical protein PV789_00770 [Nocardiopsis sp. HUAS JQ3]